MENTSAMIIENLCSANGKLTDQLKRIRSELKNCRNELCCRCGQYRHAHEGACDDCRYMHGGEWERDMNDA